MSTRWVRRTLQTWGWPHAAALAAIAMAGLLPGSPAAAQFPDVLSGTECPGCAELFEGRPQTTTAAQPAVHAALPAAARLPLLAGIWSSALTSSDDPAWALEDFFCVVACTPAARAAATALLNDPANAHRPMLELLQRVRAPRFACDRHGFAAQVVSPLPLQIEQRPGRVVLHYEEFGAERTVLLGGHHDAPGGASTSFGVSTGRFEDGSFVVETSHVPAGRFNDGLGGGTHSDRLRAIERYLTSDDGNWLFLVLKLEDPETLSEPLILTKSWRRMPTPKILRHGCDVMSGQLEGVLAEYFDPAKLDARRK